MCRGFHRRFSTVPAGNALSKLAVRERTLASLDAATGLRVNELLALGWGDVNLENLERRVTRSIWHQVLGNCKAEASAKPVPMDSPHGRGSSPLAPSEYLRIG
jgi:integrase